MFLGACQLEMTGLTNKIEVGSVSPTRIVCLITIIDSYAGEIPNDTIEDYLRKINEQNIYHNIRL